MCPIKRLVKKLHGIQGLLLKWIEDCLYQRQQTAVVNGIASSWTEVTSGIPKGSVLGPILFLIYKNDLPDATHYSMKLFADDAKMFPTMNICNRQATFNWMF